MVDQLLKKLPRETSERFHEAIPVHTHREISGRIQGGFLVNFLKESFKKCMEKFSEKFLKTFSRIFRGNYRRIPKEMPDLIFRGDPRRSPVRIIRRIPGGILMRVLKEFLKVLK